MLCVKWTHHVRWYRILPERNLLSAGGAINVRPLTWNLHASIYKHRGPWIIINVNVNAFAPFVSSIEIVNHPFYTRLINYYRWVNWPRSCMELYSKERKNEACSDAVIFSNVSSNQCFHLQMSPLQNVKNFLMDVICSWNQICSHFRHQFMFELCLYNLNFWKSVLKRSISFVAAADFQK